MFCKWGVHFLRIGGSIHFMRIGGQYFLQMRYSLKMLRTSKTLHVQIPSLLSLHNTRQEADKVRLMCEMLKFNETHCLWRVNLSTLFVMTCAYSLCV